MRTSDLGVVATSNLGSIEILQDKVHSLEEKVVAQDNLISILVSERIDNEAHHVHMAIFAHGCKDSYKVLALQVKGLKVIFMNSNSSSRQGGPSHGGNKDGQDGGEEGSNQSKERWEMTVERDQRGGRE